MALNTKNSIVDYLKSQKQDASFANRTTLAKKYGISNYTGTAQQNTSLLGKVQKPPVSSAKPIIKPPVKPPVTGAKPPVTGAKPPVTAPVNPLLPPKTAPTQNTGQSGAGNVGNVGTPNVVQPNQPPKDFATQLQDKINAMYDAQQKQRLEEFYAARDKGIADINSQKAALAPQFADQRGQVDVVQAQNMQRMKEQMANQGLQGSGENVTANIGANQARTQALTGLNQEEMKQKGAYDKAITDLNDPSQELAIKNDIAAQKNQALYDAFLKGDEVKHRDEETAYAHGRDVVQDKKDAEAMAYQKERDKMSDSQWKQEFDRGKVESDREFKQRQAEFSKNYQLDMDKFLYDKKVTEREWKDMSPAKQKEMALSYKYDLSLKKASGGGGGGGGGGGSTKSKPKAAPKSSPKYTNNVKDTTKTKGYKEQSSTYDMKMYKAMYGEQAYSQYLADQKKKKK